MHDHARPAVIPDTFRVGLLLTEQCNIACRHCWFNSSPEKRSNMKLDEAYSYIDQANEIPTVEWISFTGGEPFLLYEMLRTLIKYASYKGLKTECVTNCFWAESEEGAENILRDLVKSGLDVINISVDDFHQEHIPFTRVKNCYQASKSVGLKIVIMSASARTNKLRLEKITNLLGRDEILTRYKKDLKYYSAIAVETCFLPIGRGANIPESELILGLEPTCGPCKSVLKDVAVTPSGEVLPCCSGAGLLDVMRLGNISNGGLKDVLEEASQRKLFRTLSSYGPEGLLKLLGDNVSRGYVSRCHMCYEVLIEASSSNLYSTFFEK